MAEVNANISAINKLANQMFPGFLEGAPVKPTFICLKVESDVGALNQVFLRSKTDWDSHPIRGFVSSGGLQWANDVGSTRRQMPYVVDERYIIGPSGSYDTARTLRKKGVTYRSELLAYMNAPTFPRFDPADPRDLWYKTGSPELLEASFMYKHVSAALGETGCSPMAKPVVISDPAHPLYSTGEQLYPVDLAKFDSGKLIIWFPGDRQVGSPRRYNAYSEVVLPDNSLGAWAPARSFNSTLASGTHYLTDVLVMNAGPTVVLSAQRSQEEYNAGRFNPLYSQDYKKATNVPLVRQVFSPVDDDWVPLLTSPGDGSLIIMSRCDETSITISEQPLYHLIEVVMSSPTIAGKIPFSWWQSYGDRMVREKKMTAASLASSIEKSKDQTDVTLSFIAYDESVAVPEGVVDRMQIVIDYRKAKEEACEDDDILSKEFCKGVTYGSLQTKLNGLKQLRTVYGFRQEGAESPSFVSSDAVRYVGSTYKLGTATVTTKTSAGMTGPNITAANVELLFSMIAGGALAAADSVGTTDQQLVIWGLDPATVNGQFSGMSSVAYRLRRANMSQIQSQSVNFNWDGVSVGGFPDYASWMNTQRGYSMLAVHAATASVLGQSLRKAMLQELRTRYQKYAY